ncbi:MAG: holin family protein [Roseinatronobacter sp.]|jgi:hypothetical protein|nr:holin family protein [Roseinatronobacter sp.]
MMRALAGLVFGGAGRARDLGHSVTTVAEVFRPNATRALELGHDAYLAAHSSNMAEFTHIRAGRFDALVNGLNRLPRPLLALGTLALFGYAMADPQGFGLRMSALALVPEPLWWLLGAVVAFYFGARETHYLRGRTLPPMAQTSENAALAQWQASTRAESHDP